MHTDRFIHVVLLLLLGSLLVTRAVALEVVGSVGGACPSVAAKDGYVYLCEGRGLTVLDARADGDPVVIERVRLDAGTTCVRLDNDVAYVGTVDKKVRLYSLANPASPPLLSTITLIGGSLTDAAFEGGHAFFANNGGVEIVDVSSPAAPVAVSRYELAYNPDHDPGRSLCVLGTRMFVTSGVNCQEVDVSDPSDPLFLANLTPPDDIGAPVWSVEAVRSSGSDLYVDWYILFHNGGFFVSWDEVAVYRRGPGELTELAATMERPVGGLKLGDLLIGDSRLYLVGAVGNGWQHEGTKGVFAYNASDPQNLTTVGSLELPDFPRRAALDGTGELLTVLDEKGLTKIEIGEGDAMSVGGHYAQFRSPRVSSFAGGEYFVATDKALALVSIDDPTAPGLSYTKESNSPFISVTASGRYLYLSNYLEGLDVRYVTPKRALANVGTLDPLAWENLENPKYGGLALAGEAVWLAYSAGETGAWTVGLVGFDISSPLRPTTVGRIDRASSVQYMPSTQIAVSGGRACVVADKLYFFDISDPISPSLLSELQTGSISGFELASWTDGLVLLMDTDSRLLMVDASDAANPVLLEPSSPLPGGGSLKWVENGRAYIALSGGLDIYRVVPGGEPVLLESFASRGRIDSVEVYGGHVYAMDSEDGLLVMKTNFPDHRAQRHLLGGDTGAADQNGDGVIDAADLVLAMAAARR